MSLRVLLLAALPLLTASNCGDNIVVPTGRLSLSWTITLDGNPVASCSEVGATHVEVLSIVYNDIYSDRLPCDDFEGTTGDIEIERYNVTVSLLDADGSALQSIDLPTSVDVSDDSVIELGTFDFVFGSTPRSSLDLHIDFGEEGGSNCDDEEVVQEEVFLYDAGSSTCLGLAVTGTDQGGDPIDGNTCGTAMSCLEATVAQTVEVPAGDYEIEILGFRAGEGAPVLCYRMDAPLALAVTGDTGEDILVPFNPAPEDEEACAGAPVCTLPNEPCTGDECCIGACTGTAVTFCTCLGPGMTCEVDADCCSNDCDVEGGCACSPEGGYCATMFDCCSDSCDLDTQTCLPPA